VKLGMPESIKT